MKQKLLIILITFLSSAISVLFVLKISKKYKLYDTVDDRKMHSGKVSRLGGIGIFIGFALGLFLYDFLKEVPSTWQTVRILAIVLAGALIFIMGVLDDLHPWKARYKLLVQLLAALTVVSFDFTFKSISFSTLDINIPFHWFRYIITFGWIVGVTNAVNLIDGIDGLAGSLSAIATLSFAAIFYLTGQYYSAMICLILVAAIAGFLLFNLPFPKARLFMGDSGSQFLGFMLAVLPLVSNIKTPVSIGLPFAFGILLIPIFDTIAAFWRRIREKRSFFDPDKFHLHHKLIMLGFTTKHALYILISLQLIVSLLTVLAFHISGISGLLLLVAVYFLGILFFTVIHIKKEELLEKSKELEV